jgi:autotransporter-associated beta strand protein
VLQGTANLTIQGASSGSGADGAAGVRLRKAGSGNYSGTITVLETAKLELQTSVAGPGSPIGTGKIGLTAGTSAGNRLGTYSQLNVRNDFNGDINLGNDVSVQGAGFVNINPIGTAPSGSVTALGNLRIGDGQTLGVNKNDGTFIYSVSFSSVSLAGGSISFAPNTIGMGYTGTADLVLGPISQTVAGSGVSMDGSGGLYLSAVNTYSGGTALNAGTTYLGAPGALPHPPFSCLPVARSI